MGFAKQPVVKGLVFTLALVESPQTITLSVASLKVPYGLSPARPSPLREFSTQIPITTSPFCKLARPQRRRQHSVSPPLIPNKATVIVIGSPRGLEQSVTTGIV